MFGTFLDKNKTYYKLEPLLDLKYSIAFALQMSSAKHAL